MNEKMNIGIIGMGFLGNAINHGFCLHANIKIYDKFKEGFDTLEDVINSSEILFFCLPTPMFLDDGSQDLSVLEGAIKDVHDKVPDNQRRIAVIKSTVLPGTNRMFQKKYPKFGFVSNPEFLTARNNRLDFICAARNILGGSQEDVDRVDQLYKYRFGNSLLTYKTTWESAELTKYGANCFFALKVSYFNFIYDLCDKIGVDYEQVKDMILADNRIARSHTDVPGHDGGRGYSGTCLVGDSTLLTKNGFKKISDVGTQDTVFDGESFTKVLKVGQRDVDKTVIIKARGRKIEGSVDHIHMVEENNKLVEKRLGDVTVDDWLYIPKPKTVAVDEIVIGKKPSTKSLSFWKDSVKITPKIARLMGLYAGEGFSGIYKYNAKNCVKKEYCVFWTFGPHEEYLADEVLDTLASLGVKANKKLTVSEHATFGKSTTWCVRARKVWLYMFFKCAGLGNGAFSKNCPIFSGDNAEGFISGWLDTDGSFYKKTNTISGFSRSTDLIKKIDLMLLNLGICSFIKKNGQEINISMRDDVLRVSKWMKSKRFYADEKNYITNISYSSPSMRKFQNGWLVKVKSVTTANKKEKVFHIETESGLYTANMILTHNCFPKDINALIDFCNVIGVDSRLLEASWQQNLTNRPDRDWESLPSAVSKKT